MRGVYSLLLYLLAPVAVLRLWIKGRRVPGYRRHWRERFARQPASRKAVIWVHAVSVGEVRAAAPLLEALLRRDPARPALLTVTTPAGRETVRQLFGDRVACRYLPYDLPGAVERFLRAWQPVVAVFAEVELWPNLYAAIAARKVPLYLVNARLTATSLRRYRRAAGLMRATVACIAHVAAQSAADAERLRRLGVGAADITVCGNLKFAACLAAGFSAQVSRLQSRLSGAQPIWVAASTHAGEESIVLSAHLRIRQRFAQALLLLVPRHPERAAELRRQCDAAGLAWRFSSAPPLSGAAVVIVDQLGLLLPCYGVAQAAFIGGSLIDRGGHNPIEALLAGVPVIYGPYPGNFTALYARLQAAGAARRGDDAETLAAQLCDWFADAPARRRASRAGRAVVGENQDVLPCTLAVLGAPPHYRARPLGAGQGGGGGLAALAPPRHGCADRL